MRIQRHWIGSVPLLERAFPFAGRRELELAIRVRAEASVRRSFHAIIM
jgi:hypothetical protein